MAPVREFAVRGVEVCSNLVHARRDQRWVISSAFSTLTITIIIITLFVLLVVPPVGRTNPRRAFGVSRGSLDFWPSFPLPTRKFKHASDNPNKNVVIGAEFKFKVSIVRPYANAKITRFSEFCRANTDRRMRTNKFWRRLVLIFPIFGRRNRSGEQFFSVVGFWSRRNS
jgi:hypothetical protein